MSKAALHIKNLITATHILDKAQKNCHIAVECFDMYTYRNISTCLESSEYKHE